MRKQVIAAVTAIVLGIATTATGTVAFARGGGGVGGGRGGGFSGGGHVGGLGVGHIGGLGSVGHIGGLGSVGHVRGLGGVGHIGGLAGVGHIGGLGDGVHSFDGAARFGGHGVATAHSGFRGHGIAMGHSGFGHGHFKGRHFGRGLYAYGVGCGLNSDWTYSGYCDPNCYPYGCH
jgi:hypothetical protein